MPRCLLLLFLLCLTTHARDVRSEIKRANDLNRSTGKLLIRNEFQSTWTEDGKSLVFSTNDKPDGRQHYEVSLETGAVTPIAADAELKKRLTVSADLVSPREIQAMKQRNGPPTTITIQNQTGGEIEVFWLTGDKRKSYGRVAHGETFANNTSKGHRWLITDANGNALAGVRADHSHSMATITGKVEAKKKNRSGNRNRQAATSPDSQWRAFTRDHNVFIESTGDGRLIQLTTDGTGDSTYQGPFAWSPDSRKLVAFHEDKVPVRKVRFIESTPEGQLQPKLHEIKYNKPGDPIAQPKPRLFDVSTASQIAIDDALFENPWDINNLEWNADSAKFWFIYNQRGHQVLRAVAVDAANGNASTLFEETHDTFIDYSQKSHLTHLPETREIIWASERDGYNHLYLIDETTGSIKKQLTKGNWNVRKVENVDAKHREILIQTIGLNSESPYYIDYARVAFDGTFTRLTQAPGTHDIEFSPDRRFFIDTWSRVDQPPVRELRRSDDGSLVTELIRTDDSALTATGWHRLERFTAKGRDGKTDIHGVIARPSHFDPDVTYPVLEYIYAGPHGFFTPQSYQSSSFLHKFAELGFIVVQLDGMGTNWRSRAFHDNCWKNLADAGFPDRKLWITAAAETRPWMDLDRLGIFGGSAGGQNALAALLFHHDFYHVAVADCGCHDNRMDKVWWNEAWMGWPVDESYARNSNAVNAHKLEGELLLIVGEVDSNVDPASTAQVVAALQKADKDFEFMPIMGANHGAAETSYGNYRRVEFLIRKLNPPLPPSTAE